MKLHLPVGLRAALLAVLLCSPMAMGSVSVYNVASDGTHKDVLLEDAGDGKATYEDSGQHYQNYPEEYVIFVDGKTDGDHPFTQLECKTLSNGGKTTVTVGQGGLLQFTEGSSLGQSYSRSSFSEVVVNIDGGTLNAGFSSSHFGYIDSAAPQDSRSKVTFGVTNKGNLSLADVSIGEIAKSQIGATGGATEISITADKGSILQFGLNHSGRIADTQGEGSETITTISIDGEGTTAQLYEMSIGCIKEYAQNALSTTTLSVTDHAEFSMIHGGNIGCLEGYDSTAHTDIVVSGGASFTMGEESNTHLGRYSYATFMHSTTLQSYAGEVEMNISVTKGEGQEEGGHFTMKSGSIGWCGGIDSKTLGAAVAPKTSLAITVDGGTFSVEEDSKNANPLIIGGVNLSYKTATSVSGSGTNETTIAVSNGGVFAIDCVKNSNYINAGVFFLGQAHYDGATVESYTLNVSENGKFIMTAEKVTDEKNPGIAYLGYAYKGGTVENLAINISTGGSLSIIPSTSTNTNKAATQGIGFAEATSSGEVSSITTEINLQDGGKMDIAAAQKDTAPSGIGDVIAKKGGTATANTSISVGGKDSSFTFTSGDIGMVYVDGNASSTGTANTSVTVEEGGTFTMTGGRLGYAYAASNDKGTVNQKFSLTMTGGKMEIKGGSIFEKKNTASSSTRTGSIELSGDSVLTIGKDVTIGDVEFDITMHGGTLAGEGISKLTEKVSTVTIDTGDQFKGKIGLGGIGAEKITSIKINSGDIAIVDIGTGTLTLGAGDILTVGEKNAWDGKDVSPAPGGKQALLQFKTEGSGSPSERCTVDVSGNVTLNFDGQYLAKQKGEDDSVSLRVWITNGKLAGEGETSVTWAKEHFTIGTGWGLEVTSYDADQGMLILEGTSTVWVATVDGDDGNRHAAANASDLGKYTKVIVDEGTTFTADGDATIQQLEGRGEGSQLVLEKREKSATITLNNVDKERGDTVFESSISAQEGVNLRKTGDASLTVQGTLQAGGNVTVAEGMLTLGDGDNSISGALTVGDAESGTSGTLDVQGNLSAKGAVNVAAGELVLEGDNNTVEGALSMGAEGKLQVKQALTLSGTSDLTAGTLTGEGTITVAKDNGNLTVGNSEVLDKGLSLQVEGSLTLRGKQQRGTEEGEGAITGSGTLTVDKEGQLSTGSHLNMGISGVDVQGILSQGGGQIAANNIVVGKDGTYELKDGTINALPQGDAPGTLSLNVAGAFEMSGGKITGGAFTLSDTATLTQSKGTIDGGSITLNGSATMEKTGGEVTNGTLELNDNATLTQSNGTIDGGSITLRGSAKLTQSNGTIDGASITLNGSATMKQTGGEVADGTSDLSSGATLTQSNGTINGSSITLSNGAQMSQKGEAVIKGGTITLSGEGTSFAQEGGSIGEGAKFSLSDSATLTQTGGQITGGTLELSDSAALIQSDAGTIDGGSITLNSSSNLTQSNGTINGASIKLSGSATMKQDGGQITGGTLDLDGAKLTQSNGAIKDSSITLSGGAKLTQSDAGTINGGSITLSGEGTGFTQAGGGIGEDATFSLKDGAKLTLKGGSMNAAVTMEGEASLYDMGNQAAKGDIIMKGGSLAKAENYAGNLTIQTDATYTGSLDLGGVDAAHITKVQIGASETELRNLKSDSTLTFREGDEMVVGVQHVYREGQTEPAGGSMVQFQGEKGQIAFDGDSALRLHLKSEVLKGLEGQLEILFTDGSFSGMPEGGQKELKAWLGEHFVLDAGLEDIKVLLLNDAEGGHLILTGSSSGIWIASRNGQNVDVADLLNHYSAVIADKDLTLTLPPTQEETPTIVNQLQNERETHGDFIVKTESGATAGHTVQLHNANTNGDNGGTEFYGNIRVEGTGLEAATLEKTGDAALNVHGNLESSGTVQVKEGALALSGEANSVGTLAMSGGKLQVDGTLALTGRTEMSEESSGSISGEGNVKLGSGASLTLAGGVSYGVQNTQLENGAQMSQKGEAAIKGGSITLSGEGTGYTQAGGTISGTTFTLTEGTSFTQAGGSIGEGATFSLSDGATLTLSGGSMNGAVSMEGKTSRYDLGNQAAQGSITMHGGSLANAGNYAGSLVIQTGDTYTGALDLGGVDAARITSIQLAGKDTYLTGLKEGSTLTLHTDNSFKVTEQNAWVDGKGGPEGKQAFFQFGTAGAGEVGTESVVNVASGAKITLNFVGQQIAEAVGEDGGITLNVWITNGQLGGGKTGEAAVTWAKEHFVIGTGWGLDVESYDAAQGMLVLKGQSNIWDAAVDGTEDAVGHVSVDAKKLSQFDKVVIDERTTMTAEGPDGVVRQLEGSKDLEIQGSGTVAFENKHEESAFVPTGDTTLHGNIVAGDEVDLRKTGDASLTVEGDLKAGGDVAVEEGKLAIGGNDSFIDGELSLGKKGAGGEEGGTSGTLQVDGKLTLSGGVSEDSQGSITGSGTVVLDGDFTVGDVELGKDLTFQMGEKAASANFGHNAVTLQDLEGKKNVTAGGVTLTGEGTFSGTITGDTTMQGEYALSGANINGTLDNSGKESVMILSDASEEALQVQKNLVLRKDATTRIFMDLSNGDLWQGGASDTMVNVSRNIIIEDGTIFEIHNLKDIIASNEDLKNVVIMRGAHVYAVHGRYEKGSELDEGTIGKQQMDKYVKVNLTGTLNWRYKEAHVSFMNSEAAAAEAAEEKIALFRKAAPAAEASGSTVSLTLIDQDVNPVIAFAETFNEKAGAALLSGHVLRSSINGVDPDVERVAEVIADAMQSNPSVAHKALAAMAGSTLTSVSAAQSAALRNQTSRVRDHALQAARLRCAGNDEATQQQRPCKTTHVWVEGTSFFSEQHSIGDESGYRLNSWGGAVGIDAQVNAHWSVGLSLAANYGDLEARAADYAKGDLDSYYVSAWSQAKNGRWGNTLLFTVGTNEADLRRTVNYGAGSYTATSNASGSSLGAMWELTCDFHPVKENKSNILQPLFNVAVQHTSMDGFSEKNAGGVGLATEKQTRDTMTLGLGLRWLAAIDSAKAVNRTVSTELHANVAQDLGDRRSVANVALLTDPNFTQSVYGSKTGSTAFQFGAGVNVPMTPNSCIYVNAGGELREHANTWSATLGVRMGF